MAYDIFISYRRDGGKELARPLKSELELRGYRVFLDFDELKDGVFDRRIMEAIDAAPIFMVILSPHALDRCANADDWVRREIEYALEHDRHFIPIDPDRSFTGFPPDIPDTLKAGLGQHQFSQVMFEQLFKVSVDKMVRERIEPLLQQVGRAAAQEQTRTRLKLLSNADCRVSIDGEVRAKVAAGKLAFLSLAAGEYWLEAEGTASNTADAISRTVVMDDRDRLERLEFTLLKTTYKVGDYYNENGKEGVVFEVDATGCHGKIVGMTQELLQWCTKEQSEKEIETTDLLDGQRNQQTIEQIANWREKYPAFAWCAAQGKGWYLPAIRELINLLANDTVHDAVNRTLEKYNAVKLFNRGESAWYWSSSGENKGNTKPSTQFVYVSNGYTFSYCKFYNYYVRAVSTF